MLLSDLARCVPGSEVVSGAGYEVRRVVYDSRRASPGDLFVALEGTQVDGHLFAREAASRGAAVAVAHPAGVPAPVAELRVRDTRAALGELAAELEGRPARRLLIVGVTGTDGKTTVTHMASHLLESAGVPTGFLSTVAHKTGGAAESNASGQTTMEAPEIQAALGGMVRSGARAAVIETTSHALVQRRVDACEFDVAAVTNVGRDHLDYHSDWEDYLAAKGRLIALCAQAADKGVVKTAVLNRDDASYERLTAAAVSRRISYSTKVDSDVRAVAMACDADGSRFRLQVRGESREVRLRLPAGFNVSNALCAAGIGLALGLSPDQSASGLSSFPGVAGRLQRVDLGQPFAVYIDFAHAAGSLASVLAALRPLTRGRLLCVFGSTGRADHDRAGMGRAAAEGADWFVITTDDPVNEDPAGIAREVETGAAGRVRGSDYEVEPDRRVAIRRAISAARAGDTVLLAGKGHEQTMMLADGSVPWDERAEAESVLRELGLAGR